jgi:hypothetical protein
LGIVCYGINQRRNGRSAEKVGAALKLIVVGKSWQAFADGVNRGLVMALVGRAADEDEAAVAIAAIDEALLVNLQIDARMAERGTTGNLGGSVAGDAGGGDSGGSGGGLHHERG